MVAPPDLVPRADERKLVTILFADLVGSTSLAEGLDPERLQVLLATYFGAMSRVIEGWGGTVEKYIGDAIMAVFGVPSVHEDDPQRAISAALDMVSTLDVLNREFQERHGVELQIRIGVNTGNVVAPVGGPPQQMIVAGDAVNVAARLEAAAEPGGILVGARTYEAAREGFRFEGPSELELRGKSGPVHAWTVTSRLAAPGERQAKLQSPLVGRDREIRILTDALDDSVESGEPRLQLVFGPAGIGKSRLAREFIESARRSHEGLSVLRGRCLSVGDGITYWALGEIVRGAFGISLDDAPELARERLATGVRTLLEPLAATKRDIDQTFFALATSAGMKVPNNPLEGIRPIAVASELGRAWPRFATATATSAPTVIFVEDLHWADDQLLAILEALAARSRGPVLVLATARPEFAEDHASFGVAREGTSSMTLRPLHAPEAAKLVEGLLGWESVPESIRAQVTEHAEGNPFFVEQLVGGLIDAGAIVRADDGWNVGGQALSTALPDTLQAILAARIDRLGAAEKRVLQEASVVGRTFWPSAVALSSDGGGVPDALDVLESKGLILARPFSSLAGEPEYAFKHALIHDVVYAGIPMARRARSHAAVGQWLEELAGEADEGLLELVAHHYREALLADGADLAWLGNDETRAALRDQAFRVLLAAGAVARQRNAISRAIELHEAALHLAADDDERAQLYEELGDDHGWAYHGPPSVEAWDRAIHLRRAAGRNDAVARICVKAARACVVYWGGFPKRPSGAVVDGYIDEGLSHHPEAATKAWLLALRGRASEAWATEGLPDPVSAPDRIGAAEEAVELARTLGDVDLQVVALRSLGGLFIKARDFKHSLELAHDELAIADRMGAARDRVIAINQAESRIMEIGGDLEQALELGLRTLAAVRDLSAHDRMHATYFVMAPLYLLGRLEEIEPIAMEHIRAYDEETVDMDCPYTRSGSVVAALALELLDKQDVARQASERIAPNPERPGLVEAWMAERALQTGDPATARQIAETLVAAGREPSLEEAPYEQASLILALAALGDWTALDAAEPGARAESERVVWIAPAIDRAEAMRSLADGDLLTARDAWERALRAYESLGMAREATEVRDRLATLPASR